MLKSIYIIYIIILDFNPPCSTIEEFEIYDKTFESNASIYDLGKVRNHLQDILNKVILQIVNDEM